MFVCLCAVACEANPKAKAKNATEKKAKPAKGMKRPAAAVDAGVPTAQDAAEEVEAPDAAKQVEWEAGYLVVCSLFQAILSFCRN